MLSASSAAAREPNLSPSRTASVRDLPLACAGGRSRVVIRLPALPSEDAESNSTTPLASKPMSKAPEVELEASFDSVPAEPNDPEEMTTFVIPHTSPETTETALPNLNRNLTPSGDQAVAGASTNAAKPSIAPQRSGPVLRNVNSAWGLVRQGHAFVMQPKVWLACVLCCFGVLLTVFVLLSPEEESPKPAAKASHVEKEKQVEPATRIVAPPADLSPAADAGHFEIQASPGYVGQLGPELATENGSEAAGEAVRMASDPKLGPRNSRYDGQAPGAEQGGAAIYDVTPLDRSGQSISEDGRLR